LPLPDDEDLVDPVSADQAVETTVETRRILQLVERTVSKGDWELLRAIGVGVDYAELAVSRGTTPGALRVRVARLRRVLIPLAA
jgi:hypothetical protein